jgi:hypothetical protein
MGSKLSIACYYTSMKDINRSKAAVLVNSEEINHYIIKIDFKTVDVVTWFGN